MNSRLETIAAHCRRVPESPPATFWEACQALWFCCCFLPDAPGRVDQYLYPFYARDRERGTIDPERARQLLSCLWIKYFETAGARAGHSAPFTSLWEDLQEEIIARTGHVLI